MKLRGELRMIERALNQGWQTPHEVQRHSIELVLATLDDKSATARETSAALRCVHAIVKQDSAMDAEIEKRLQDAERDAIKRLSR